MYSFMYITFFYKKSFLFKDINIILNILQNIFQLSNLSLLVTNNKHFKCLKSYI